MNSINNGIIQKIDTLVHTIQKYSAITFCLMVCVAYF